MKNSKIIWDYPERPPYGPEPQVVIRQLKDSDRSGSEDSARLEQWKKLLTLSDDTDSQQATIKFGCLPPAGLYDTYRELLTDLPDYLGGGPVTVLTDGMQGVSGTVDLKMGALEGTIDSASSAAASAFADQATQLLKSLPTTSRDQNAITKLILPLLQRSTFQPVESQVRWQIAASADWRLAEGT